VCSIGWFADRLPSYVVVGANAVGGAPLTELLLAVQ
jgi:hypothetical protein